LRPQDLAIIGQDGNTNYDAGKISISIGGGQPDATSTLNKSTIEGTVELIN
jgi:beta-glucosidase